jgi:hypothetical protein
MKIRLFILITCCLGMGKIAAHAQVKPYMAIIHTDGHVHKGILFDVTPDSIGVQKDKEVVFLQAANIKTIKVKEVKRGFRYKNFMNYDPQNEKNYQKVTNKMVPVRKWGEKDPTIEEELSGRIITSFYNTALNSVFASIGLMNGSSNVINVNFDCNVYKENAKKLFYHSIAYQQNPGETAAQQDLKVSLNQKGN